MGWRWRVRCVADAGRRAGSPLGGSEGAIDGASCAVRQHADGMDSVVKPTTAGFEADTLLRSVESPQQLYFRVGMPEGASLVQAKDGSGAVEVVKEGTAIATVLPPGAQDAAGTAVPVSMSRLGRHAGVERRRSRGGIPVSGRGRP